MVDAKVRRRYGQVFDQIAEQYDRARRGYPGELIDAACTRGALAAGDPVLEVGCGTGLLTESLVARGLRVDALDPGANMLRFAARRVGESAAVRFHQGRFEDVELPANGFAAVFSATAFHWVEPSVGWAKAAGVLRPGGMLALIQQSDLGDTRPGGTWEQFQAALHEAAPEVADGMPRPRGAEELLAGMAARRENISELWSWLGSHELAVPEAAELFEDVQIETVPVASQWTAEELNAQFRTTSLHARVPPERRSQLESATHRIVDRQGGTVRFEELAVLVSARAS